MQEEILKFKVDSSYFFHFRTVVKQVYMCF